jgi:hypothetical protein
VDEVCAAGTERPVALDEHAVFAGEGVVVSADHAPGVLGIEPGEEVLDVTFFSGFTPVADHGRIVAAGPGCHCGHVQNPHVVGRSGFRFVLADPDDQCDRRSVGRVDLVTFDNESINLRNFFACEK